MYQNIKLMEEFELELKELFRESVEPTFVFSSNDSNMDAKLDFNAIDDEDENNPNNGSEQVERNFDNDQNDKNLVKKENSVASALSKVESELDEDDDEEDFDGDGEDDIDPDELDDMVLGFDDEIEELGDEEIEDDQSGEEKVIKENYDDIDKLLDDILG